MLQKLLAEIRQGGTLRPETLAVRLDVSVGLVEIMLADLERRGLIVRIDSACATQACGGCPLSSSCAGTSAQPKTWMLATAPHQPSIIHEPPGTSRKEG